MFRLTAVLRLQVCSGWIGPRRSAWPFSLIPTLSLRGGGLVCVSPDSCVAFTSVFGIDRAMPISLPLPPHPNPLPQGEGGWSVFRLTAVLRLHVFGMDRAMPISLPLFPHSNPLPQGEGAGFVFRLTAVLRLQVCSGWIGPCRSACPFPLTPALSQMGEGAIRCTSKPCFGRWHRMYADLETGHRPVPSPPWGEG